jgi:hypothetical protein
VCSSVASLWWKNFSNAKTAERADGMLFNYPNVVIINNTESLGI